MDYLSSLGPGPGFFPFWLGLGLAALAVVWLVQATTGPDEAPPEPLVPSRGGLLRIVAIVAALALFAALVDVLGFRLTMLAFLLLLLLALGRPPLPVTLAIAVVGSFGVYHAFTAGLHVPLPTAAIPVLQELGL
jgi:putative tricarboxylic transport membrane protein